MGYGESMYDHMFDDIPMFVVPGTENSKVIRYETNMQRAARLMSEARIRQLEDNIDQLRIQIAHAKLVGPWKQNRLPERCGE